LAVKPQQRLTTEHKMQKCFKSSLQLPQANVKLTQYDHTSILFLSPGIVYWVQTLLHWCDSYAVFIADVSRVYANSLPQMARSKIKAYASTAFLKIFRVAHRKKDKNTLDTGYQHFEPSPNSSTGLFVIKYQSFTKFSIR